MMRLRGLSTRDRRTLALGVGAIATIILAGRGVPLWRAWTGAMQERAFMVEHEVLRAESLVKGATAIEDSLHARSQRLATLRPTLLSGDTPTAAGAQLAALLSAAAKQSNVEIGPLDIRVDSARPYRLTSAQVHVAANGDIEGLTQFVGLLEAGPTRCAIQSLAISQADPAGSQAQPETLHADLIVQGLYASTTLGVAR